MDLILEKLNSIWNYLACKGGFVAGTVLTAFLTAIGYPKQVIWFIICLIIADVLSRWVAAVVTAYGNFSFVNFLKAWRDKVLNSKKLKHGLFLKLFFYAILLIIAHQTSIINELAFGQVISTFLYSIIIILDCISILENMIESGYTKFQPLLKFFNKKKEELMSENNVSTEEVSNISETQHTEEIVENPNEEP